MIYSLVWLYVSIGLLVVFLIGYFLLSKFKVVPVIFPYTGSFGFFSFFQKLLIFLILLVSLLLPLNIWFYQWTKIEKVPTLNIEVLLDVSLSMTVKDIKPDRFTAVKRALNEFIKSLWSNYNIWLIIFSWKPVVWIPFSDDKKALNWKISHMSMADFPPTLDFVGTAIGDAILLWWEQLIKFSNKEEFPGVLVLLTDGDSNKGVKVEDAIKYAKMHKIPIFVWAIWEEKEYIVWVDRVWWKVPTQINLKMLKKIAKDTWWEFKHIKSKADLIDILWELKSYVKKHEITKHTAEYTYINYYLSWILFFLLILYGIFFIRFKLNTRG